MTSLMVKYQQMIFSPVLKSLSQFGGMSEALVPAASTQGLGQPTLSLAHCTLCPACPTSEPSSSPAFPLLPCGLSSCRFP